MSVSYESNIPDFKVESNKGGSIIEKAYYEVIKFVSQGAYCRVTMDYLPGELLFDRVKKQPKMMKELLFEWMLDIITQLEQFNQCNDNRSYRYFNPYSVLVGNDNKVYLLDLEAKSNDFVLKNLQNRVMRTHFLRPHEQGKDTAKANLDLFGFGKTIQFILAHSHIEPSLTKREEQSLSLYIGKCLSEKSKKKFLNIGQGRKELQKMIHNKKLRKEMMKYKWPIFLFALLFLGVLLFFLIKGGEDLQGTKEAVVKEYVDREEEVLADREEIGADIEKDMPETTKQEEVDIRLEEIEDEIAVLNESMLSNQAMHNQRVIADGQELELEIVRILASAYDREDKKEEAIQTYARLMQIEIREALIEKTIMRKMRLEKEMLLYEQALESGKQGLGRLEEKQNVALLYLEIMEESGFYSAEEIEEAYQEMGMEMPKLEEGEEVS
ncbi:MAG: hypothetical protein FWE25_06585 [Lachnospiraceae bacterium]|nr:hypothetical protein [Lachnospiraceae bacterium]